MIRSFPLTKEMKSDLLFKLTIQAVEKNIPALASALKNANSAFWADHVAKVSGELGIPQDSWPRLMQRGLLTATTLQIATIDAPRVGREGTENISLFRIEIRHRKGDLPLQYMLLKSPEFREVSAFFRYDTYYGFRFQFNADQAVPDCRGIGNLTNQPYMANTVKSACHDLMSVLNAAVEFHDQAEGIISPLRTSAQLIDVFPEAAKLLPEPAPKSKQELAPVEQINRVRDMLNKGVPQPQVGVQS